MFCTKCGSAIPEGTTVCQSCGDFTKKPKVASKRPKGNWTGILSFVTSLFLMLGFIFIISSVAMGIINQNLLIYYTDGDAALTAVFFNGMGFILSIVTLIFSIVETVKCKISVNGLLLGIFVFSVAFIFLFVSFLLIGTSNYMWDFETI